VRTISSLSIKALSLSILCFIIACQSTQVADGGSPESVENPEALGSMPAAPTQSGSYFDWPVDSAKLSRGYITNRRRKHLGLDLASRKGTQIFASHDGRVIYTGTGFRGYGKMIMIEGKGGFATLYGHLSKIIISQGAKVKQGELIGLMGRTGHATGNHLHFEIRSGNKTVNPLLYLPK
jgi:murein DD-endopeptidase MepM/ murein hydrolase activator NlpD